MRKPAGRIGICFLACWLLAPLSCGDEGGPPPSCPSTDEVEVFQEGDTLVISNRQVRVHYDLPRGSYRVIDKAGRAWIDGASAMVTSHVLVPAHRWSSRDLPLAGWRSEPVANALGQGKAVTVSRGSSQGSPAVEQTFTLLDRVGCVLSGVRVKNPGASEMKVGAVYPLFSEGDRANLFLGEDTNLRVLSNGVLNYLDFTVPLFPGEVPCLSNWSSLLFNPETGTSLSVGFLTYETAEPVVYNGPVPGAGGYGQVLQAAAQYEPAKALRPGESLDSEIMILDETQATPHEALETYADRVKAWLGVRTWLERHPERRVPAGWNSWSGSGSSGGYGTNIDEAIILENMDFADRELRRWGMNYFQIDDGWQSATGDWWVREDRFPPHGDRNGIQWLLGRAKALGFTPGLWVQAFNAESRSQTLADHPEWFADPIFGGLLGEDPRVLDLSHPGAQAHLREVVSRIRDWGAEWFKLDFGYTAAYTENWYEPNLTRGEFYRKGVRAVREALGDDVFLLNVAIVGWNYGLIDSSRLTLDTMPAWEGENDDPYSVTGSFLNQGLKPMYRDCARRYYLHGRLWLNHPDLTFYRAHADPRIPPLTLNESSTFTTAVALQGGIVKIGDRMVDLRPEAVDNLRRVLPVYGRSGRPLDLFRREFPEVWSLAVEDFDEPYRILGLLNWGINRDLTGWPHTFLEDGAREIGADGSEAGLDPSVTYLAFEFWTQEFLGEAVGGFSMTVPARTPRVVALRPSRGRPQFLGSNRHVLGGVGVIRSVTWDPGARTLTGVQEGSIGTDYAPFEHRVSLYVPAGYSFRQGAVSAPEGYGVLGEEWEQDGPVLTLRFSVTGIAREPGERHPDVTWTAVFE
jgi:hypothetical protein